MTWITLKARMATYPTDQLLAMARNGMGVCLYCGGEQPTPIGVHRVTCDQCQEPYVFHPDEILVVNLGAK
jgi:hypothetical protein